MAYCNGPSVVTSDPVEIRVVDPPRLKLTVKAKRLQRSLRRVATVATCRNIECRARAEGRLEVGSGRGAKSFKLARRALELSADKPTKLLLAIPRAARRSARSALRRGGTVSPQVQVLSTAPGDQVIVRQARAKLAR
jgi:hypothetical protein